MSRTRTSSFVVVIALLCAVLGSLSTVLVAAPAHASTPLRVLLTGDSITHGRDGDYTWRYRLYKEFQRQGVPVNFVGSRSTPYRDPGYPPSHYADPNFDQDHFALFGWELRQMVGQIGAEVQKQQPDVVVLEAGVNDFRHHRTSSTIEQSTEAALRAWIANVRAAKPDTRILLSPVLKVDTAASAAINPMITKYDADLPRIVAELSTAESPITLAATNQGWNPAGDMTWDGLHPSSTGETFIAQRIAEALRRVGILHQAPHVYRVVAWPRIERPVVQVSGTRARVTWDRQAVGAGRVWFQRAGRKAVTSPTFHPASQVVTVARGATYTFRLQVRRGKMIGRWGPVIRVIIPSVMRPAAPAHVVVNATGVHWTAVARASSYVVKYHGAHQKRWTTRRTTKLQLLVKNVAVAKVRAISAGGTSQWHQARR